METIEIGQIWGVVGSPVSGAVREKQVREHFLGFSELYRQHIQKSALTVFVFSRNKIIIVYTLG
jgi:hypothetical protein